VVSRGRPQLIPDAQSEDRVGERPYASPEYFPMINKDVPGCDRLKR
jgi:hypothetical protein